MCQCYETHRQLHSFPTRRSSDLLGAAAIHGLRRLAVVLRTRIEDVRHEGLRIAVVERERSEEHTSELQSRFVLVCRPLLEKKRLTRSRCDGEDRRHAASGRAATP